MGSVEVDASTSMGNVENVPADYRLIDRNREGKVDGWFGFVMLYELFQMNKRITKLS